MNASGEAGAAVYLPKEGSEEAQFFEAILVGLQPGSGGVIQRKAVTDLLQSSGLDKKVLGAAWNIGTNEGRVVELGRAEVYTMLRCVALAQAGRTLSKQLVEETRNEQLFPRFNQVPRVQATKAQEPAAAVAAALPPPAVGAPAAAVSAPNGHNPPAAVQWSISASNRIKYEQLFAEQSLKEGLLQGGDAASFFMQSRLPVETLRKVWNLSDTDRDGKLSKEEFCIAMQLIHVVQRTKATLPDTLPLELQLTPLNAVRTTSPKGILTPQPTGSVFFSQAQPSPRSNVYLLQSQGTGASSSSSSRQGMSMPPPQLTGGSVSSRPAGNAQQPNGSPPLNSLASSENLRASVGAVSSSLDRQREANSRMSARITETNVEREALLVQLNAACQSLALEQQSFAAVDAAVDELRTQTESVRSQLVHKQEELAVQRQALAAAQVTRQALEQQAALLVDSAASLEEQLRRCIEERHQEEARSAELTARNQAETIRQQKLTLEHYEQERRSLAAPIAVEPPPNASPTSAPIEKPKRAAPTRASLISVPGSFAESDSPFRLPDPFADNIDEASSESVPLSLPRRAAPSLSSEAGGSTPPSPAMPTRSAPSLSSDAPPPTRSAPALSVEVPKRGASGHKSNPPPPVKPQPTASPAPTGAALSNGAEVPPDAAEGTMSRKTSSSRSLASTSGVKAADVNVSEPDSATNAYNQAFDGEDTQRTTPTTLDNASPGAASAPFEQPQ